MTVRLTPNWAFNSLLGRQFLAAREAARANLAANHSANWAGRLGVGEISGTGARIITYQGHLTTCNSRRTGFARIDVMPPLFHNSKRSTNRPDHCPDTDRAQPRVSAQGVDDNGTEGVAALCTTFRSVLPRPAFPHSRDNTLDFRNSRHFCQVIISFILALTDRRMPS